MAGIKDAIKDVLAQLVTIPVTDGMGGTMEPYVRVWNNQLQFLKANLQTIFPMPAFFLEIINSPRYQEVGQGFRSADLTFRIHLVHQYLNDGQGVTYEQDLDIFDLRDKMLASLSLFRATGCGALNCILEEQDFSHDNLYHYVMDFIANFTDSKASNLDDSSSFYIDSPFPLDLSVTVTKLTDAEPQNVQQPFLIPES